MKINAKTAEGTPSFFYELNDSGVNHWNFNLQGGKNNDGTRVTPEQEDAIADEIYKRLTCHEGLVEALEGAMTELMAADRENTWPFEKAQAALDKAVKGS